MSKNILITGSTGFVGRALIAHLGKQDYHIKAAVRQHDRSKFPSSVTIIPIKEVGPQTNWHNALEQIDTVIHLAARAHVLQEMSHNPEKEFHLVNALGTENLVKQAIAANVKQFIFISSIGAMTTLAQDILTESSPCIPDTPYGISKLRAEESLIKLTSNSTMNWTTLRPTLVYGPRNPGNMDQLFKLVDRGIPLPLGAIRNQRSLIYVNNLVDAIITCIGNPKAFNQTFILSDGEDISTPHLIRNIGHALDRPVRLIHIPVAYLKLLGRFIRKSTVIDRLVGSLSVDSTHIRTTLNWSPPYSLGEGLQATANWYRDRSSKY